MGSAVTGIHCYNRQGKGAGKAPADLALTGGLKDKQEFAKQSGQGRGIAI